MLKFEATGHWAPKKLGNANSLTSFKTATRENNLAAWWDGELEDKAKGTVGMGFAFGTHQHGIIMRVANMIAMSGLVISISSGAAAFAGVIPFLTKLIGFWPGSGFSRICYLQHS